MSSADFDIMKAMPIPTIDRPFGIELWPIFSKIFTPIKGYKPETFNFILGETPMAGLKPTLIAMSIYYIVIFGGREIMRNRPAFKLKTPFIIHNFYLTAISGTLLALLLEQLIPEIYHNGIFHAICNPAGGWTNKLVLLYYLNYLTKYVEFVDTVFLVLKKKPLTFLHTYHHGATAFLCYIQLIGDTTVQWVPIVLNLTVHVLMYYYYLQSARGIKIWWKQYITTLQIIQFFLDLGFVNYATYQYFVSTYWPWMPHRGHCAGKEFAAYWGVGILTSYLFLFISFYFATYKTDKKDTGRKAAKSLTNAQLPDMAAITGAVNSRASFSGSSATTTGSSTGRATTRSRKA